VSGGALVSAPNPSWLTVHVVTALMADNNNANIISIGQLRAVSKAD